MDNKPTYGNGKICYIEIPATDVETSSAFYKNVFGWNVRTRGDGVTSFDDTVGEVSGTWRTDRKPATEITMLVHIMVFNIEDAMKKLKEHGGKIVQEVGMEFPEITARFSDPAGNIFGLYQEQS